MNDIMKNFFLLLISSMLLSCSTFNPYDYREIIEDAIRFDAICKLIERNMATSNIRNRDYNRVMDETMVFVHRAKEIHKYPTYYYALQMLMLNINDYVADGKDTKQHRMTIEMLIEKYNEIIVDLDSAFKKMNSNEYVLYYELFGDTNLECIVKQTEQGLRIDINHL